MSDMDYDDDKTVEGQIDNTSDFGSIDDSMSSSNSYDDQKTVCGDISPDSGRGLSPESDDLIELDVSIDSGIDMPMSLPNSSTVDDVIRASHNEYYDDYDLVHNGQVLPRDKMLKDAFLPRNARVKTVERKIKVHITTGNGQKYVVDIQRSASVEALKEKLRERTHTVGENPRLALNGSELNDTKILRDYNVKSGSEIRVISRCYGG